MPDTGIMKAMIGQVLRDSIGRRGIPAVAAMVATPDETTYAGAFGKLDSTSGIDLKFDSIFDIASMTKAVTTAAVLQLVEQGKVKLSEPVSAYLPRLSKPEVLTGFDDTGQPVLRPARKAITLHHLLTHTSGLAYSIWDEGMSKFSSFRKSRPTLMFEPGARWQYGPSLDWAGRLVEAVSGLTLEQYFQRNIFEPLGMKDTSFIFPAAKFGRLVGSSCRQPDGSLKEDARTLPDPPKEYNGGGGLFSTAPDYVLFMQMILRQGRGADGGQILQPKSVAAMTANQIGSLSAGKLKTFRPGTSGDVDFHPGFTDGFTYGFLINHEAFPDGRSAGSLTWAGIGNTFFWIDPKCSRCAVLMMQFMPFMDPQAIGLLGEFEKAVYPGRTGKVFAR